MNRSALAERFAQTSLPLKTFVLEAHANGDVSGFLDELGGPAAHLEPTEDAHLHRLADGDTEFFIDHLDERFWSFHTWSPAVEAHRVLKSDVERRRDLDWTWLPSGHLRRLWSEGEPTWLRCEFNGDRVLQEDDPARRMQLRLRGNSPEGLLDLVEGSPYANAIAYDQVGVAACDPEFGRVDEAANRMGRFVATGQSFELHQEIVRLAVQRYRRLVTAVEDRALSWSGNEDSGVTLGGSAIALSFRRSIPDLGRFLDAVFSSREPFRLWGVPRLIADDVARIEAVDLHVGQRLRFEVGLKWLRVFLNEGACGNTIARLITNLQHQFDARVVLDDPALQSALEADARRPDPVENG